MLGLLLLEAVREGRLMGLDQPTQPVFLESFYVYSSLSVSPSDLPVQQWEMLAPLSFRPPRARWSSLSKWPMHIRSSTPSSSTYLPGRILVRAHAPARTTTEADRATEDAVRAFHLAEGPPVVSHLVADHRPKSHEGRSYYVREAVADSISHYHRRQGNK
jgi:hypothetical protein